AVDANGATTSIVYFITSGVPFCGNSPTATAIANCNKVFVDWSGGNLVDINGNPYTQWVAQIQRVSPTLGPVVSSGYVSTLSHVFTIPTNGFGGTYQVTVSGMCNNQYSVYSNPVQVVVNDPRPLAPTVTPTSFTTNCPTVGAKTITVNWTPSGTGPAALGGWRVRAKTASSTGGYNIVASTTQTAINTLTFTVAANTTYKVYVEPMGCSNLVGAPSQVYLVTSCAQPNGNATLTTVRLDETQNYDDLITDEENNNVDIVLEAAISVYPNPNNGAFTVSAENILDETAKIEVMNMLGQVVYTQEVSTDNGLLSHEINLSNESTAGTYLVRITTKSGSYHTKFVKM
ncbi:MAG: T9SS type A sorting domain-containing protein, partial [Bacteroidia bacterium]|nr:T9SS type A sorting domain-containing protein [Bacteroidia bacterium]